MHDDTELDRTDPAAAALRRWELYQRVDALLELLIATKQDVRIEAAAPILWKTGMAAFTDDDEAVRLHAAALQIEAVLTVPEVLLVAVQTVYAELRAAVNA